MRKGGRTSTEDEKGGKRGTEDGKIYKSSRERASEAGSIYNHVLRGISSAVESLDGFGRDGVVCGSFGRREALDMKICRAFLD